MEFKVQRAGLGNAGEWKTVCANSSEDYARGIYRKQLELYSVGRFRLLDPTGKVLAEEKAAPLFSRN
jgi:hypothetical protein